MLIYFFFGAILLIFGKELEFFFKSMSGLQEIGLISIIVGFFSYTILLAAREMTITIETLSRIIKVSFILIKEKSTVSEEVKKTHKMSTLFALKSSMLALVFVFMGIVLVFSIPFVMDVPFKSSILLEKFYVIALILTILILLMDFGSKIINGIKNFNESITDPTQKITALIGFFGIVISLLTIFK